MNGSYLTDRLAELTAMRRTFALAALSMGILSGLLGAVSWASGGNSITAGLGGMFGLAAGAVALYGFISGPTDDEIKALEVRLKAAHSDKETAELQIEKERESRLRAEARIVSEQPGGEVVALDAEDQRSLSDPETLLFSEAYFRVSLEARIASARRHLRPVAIAIIEVVSNLEGDNESPADPMVVTGGLRSTLRDADTPCRLADGSFALILEDTPENGAVWTVERVRRAVAAKAENLTLRAGIACYPAHAFTPEDLLDQARVALEAAKEWHQDRIEVATAP